MATFPASLKPCTGSGFKPVESVQFDRATNGMGRGVSLVTTDKHTGLFVLRALDAADRAVLDAFYVANRVTEIDVVFMGVTYRCLFAGKPEYEWLGAGLANATVRFFEV